MGFIHTVKDWLTGGGESGGPVDAMLNFSPIGIGAAAIIGSGAALDSAAATEGVVGAGRVMGGAAFVNAMETIYNAAIDYVILRNEWRGYASDSWEKAAKGHPELDETVKKGVESHAFFLSQLKDKLGEDSPLYKEYHALGMKLPEAEGGLLQQAYRKLNGLMHPDRLSEAQRDDPKVNSLAAELNASEHHLRDPHVRNAYNDALTNNKAAMEEHFTKKSNFNWKEATARATTHQLEYKGTAAKSSKMMQWVSELNGMQKTGLAFAVVGGVALVGYGIAKIADSKTTKHTTAPRDNAASHAMRVQKNMPDAQSAAASLG